MNLNFPHLSIGWYHLKRDVYHVKLPLTGEQLGELYYCLYYLHINSQSLHLQRIELKDTNKGASLCVP